MEEGKPISRFTVNVLLHSRLIMLVICFSEHLLHLYYYYTLGTWSKASSVFK